MADNTTSPWIPAVVASVVTAIVGYFTARRTAETTERAQTRQSSATVEVARIEADSAEHERALKRLEKVENDLDAVRDELDGARDERRQLATRFQLLRYTFAVFRRKVKMFVHYWRDDYKNKKIEPSPHLTAIAEDLEQDDHEIDALLGEQDDPEQK